VAARQGPPIATATGFIDCINRRDVDGLGGLMTEDHQLEVFDEPPLTGRQETIEAWTGYVRSFPDYVIYPHRVAQSEHGVAVLGIPRGPTLDCPTRWRRELKRLFHVDRW
jgi:ketosteroid isomerase-like protein